MVSIIPQPLCAHPKAGWGGFESEKGIQSKNCASINKWIIHCGDPPRKENPPKWIFLVHIQHNSNLAAVSVV